MIPPIYNLYVIFLFGLRIIYDVVGLRFVLSIFIILGSMSPKMTKRFCMEVYERVVR